MHKSEEFPIDWGDVIITSGASHKAERYRDWFFPSTSLPLVRVCLNTMALLQSQGHLGVIFDVGSRSFEVYSDICGHMIFNIFNDDMIVIQCNWDYPNAKDLIEYIFSITSCKVRCK